MIFTSIDFIVFFVFVLAAVAIIKHRKFQHLILIGGSYYFFYFSSNYLIVLLIFSTILDFYLAKIIYNTENVFRKKLLLIISLGGNLGLLGFFKYSDFTILQFNLLGNYFDLATAIPYYELVLPLGISFYTFQTLSYTIDVYRGSLKPSKTFSEFALFVAFFPQLIAGPILRAKEFLPQLREKIQDYESKKNLRQIIFHNSNVKLGITLMAFGFIKKMFFADNIAPLVDDIFFNPIGAESFTVILGAFAFAVQVYGDFSGYTDIAIGAALILGFKIPPNFNKPYFAKSPAAFWNRWHISLSSWVRDYLYLPLIFKKRKSTLSIFLGLMLAFFLIGLWHGAGWNFIIFGIIQGFYVGIYTVIRKEVPFLRNHFFFKTKLGTIISIAVTQYLTFFSFLAFRIHDVDHLFYSMQKYLLIDFQIVETIAVMQSHKISIILMISFMVIHFISFKKGNLIEKISNLNYFYWVLFLVTGILLILLLYDGNPTDFIYFKF
jgi:alginate O-acetyltransferase complex protein AlgI|tara:strand:+ start:586 stop:2061 length:1476 start_codon:yes stop_codon:yes gene_type:complete